LIILDKVITDILCFKTKSRGLRKWSHLNALTKRAIKKETCGSSLSISPIIPSSHNSLSVDQVLPKTRYGGKWHFFHVLKNYFPYPSIGLKKAVLILRIYSLSLFLLWYWKILQKSIFSYADYKIKVCYLLKTVIWKS